MITDETAEYLTQSKLSEFQNDLYGHFPVKTVYIFSETEDVTLEVQGRVVTNDANAVDTDWSIIETLTASADTLVALNLNKDIAYPKNTRLAIKFATGPTPPASLEITFIARGG